MSSAPGHYRRRGAGWELRVYVGRDPLTDRKVYRTKTFRGTEKEAGRELARFVVEAGGASTSGTLGELLEKWYATRADGWSPKGALETRRRLDSYLRKPVGGAKRALAELKLSSLSTSDLDAFYGLLRRAGARDGGPLRAATVARVHTDLRSALAQGVKWGWLTVNPAALADPGKVVEEEVEPPAPEDVLELLARANEEDPELLVFVALAARTGRRRGELAGVRWTDLDLEAGAWTVRRRLSAGEDGVVEVPGTKGQKRPARIALDPDTIELLRGERKRSIERALACGVSLRADAYVFAGDPDGSSAHRPETWSKRFIALRNAAGLGRVRLHDLRHFAATMLLAGGVDPRTVQGRLGWASGAMLGRYAHFLEAPDRTASEALAALTARGDSENHETRPDRRFA